MVSKNLESSQNICKNCMQTHRDPPETGLGEVSTRFRRTSRLHRTRIKIASKRIETLPRPVSVRFRRAAYFCNEHGGTCWGFSWKAFPKHLDVELTAREHRSTVDPDCVPRVLLQRFRLPPHALSSYSSCCASLASLEKSWMLKATASRTDCSNG